MREFPVILEIARDIEALCPDAWVVNYVNPRTVHGIGLRRYAPQLRSFALCDSLHLPHIKRFSAQFAGILQDPEDYTKELDASSDLRIAGVNHFTWLLKADYDGHDVIPAMAEAVRKMAAAEGDQDDQGAKSKFNASIAYTLYQAYGYLPMCIAHTKEYVRFWQGLGKTPEPIPPLSLWQTEPRYHQHDAMWNQVAARYARVGAGYTRADSRGRCQMRSGTTSPGDVDRSLA